MIFDNAFVDQRLDAFLSDPDRNYCVYIWYEKRGADQIAPFYVGISSTINRYKNRSARSKVFRDFVKTHDCDSMIVCFGITGTEAREIEIRVKTELRKMGYNLLDAEDDSAERKRRIEEGIAAMPIVNGRRVSEKTGRGFGRPTLDVDMEEFERLRSLRNAGKVSVAECCERLGVGRSTWYAMVKNAS